MAGRNFRGASYGPWEKGKVRWESPTRASQKFTYKLGLMSSEIVI